MSSKSKCSKTETNAHPLEVYLPDQPSIASATLPKKPAISPEKLRAIIGGAAFGVSFAAQGLSNRDSDGEGIDDYFARKLQELAIDMQSYALTGKLPSGFTV